MTEVTLEPCPLCNGHAVMWEDGDPKYPWCVTFEHADECPLYAVPADFFRSYPTEAEAAAAWNQRHTRPASTEAVDALVEDFMSAPYEWHGPFGKEKHRIIPPTLFDRILAVLEGKG